MAQKEEITEGHLSKKEIWMRSAGLSLAVCYMFCFFEPLQLYFTNIEEYWYDIYNLAPVCTLLFCIAFAGMTLLLGLIGLVQEKLWKISYLGLGIVFVCSYIQGNYMAGRLPILDGNAVDWHRYDDQRIACIALWSIVILITLLICRKKKMHCAVEAYRWISLFILGILLFTNVTTCVMKQGMMDKGKFSVTYKNFMTMSKNGKNFVILLLDSVNGEEMEQWIETDAEIREKMKDFTYYNNLMAGYPTTLHSIYQIIGGGWYECTEAINDYRTRVLLTAPIFDALEEQGYVEGMYTDEAPFLENEGLYRFDNYEKLQAKFSSVWKFVKVEMRMVGLKYMPYDLKRRCLVLPEELSDLKAVEDGKDAPYEELNEVFLEYMQKPFDMTEENVFRFIHLWGAHAPYVYDRQLNRLPKETDYYETVGATVNMAMTYIDKLKKEGIYDNTAIIVLSDHGFNSEPCEEYHYNPYGRQHAILFIKGFQEQREEMKISNAPIAMEDLADAYLELLQGKKGDDVFPFHEGEERERRFLWYVLPESLKFTEYIQHGQAGDMDTLLPTGRHYKWPDGLVDE